MSAKKIRHEQLIARFMEYGIDRLEPYEIVEMLLGYVYSDDQAELKSKELLRRLGSTTAIMDMRVEGLIRVGKLRERGAVLLNIIPKIMRRYCVDNLDTKGMVFDTLEKIGDYCTARYYGSTDEVLSMLLIDEYGMLMGYEVIQVGSLASASVNIEKIAELLFAYDAANFVLIHNHPDGDMVPSEEDINITVWIREQFQRLGKKLVEHLIVYNNKYMPILMCVDMNEAEEGYQ